MAKRKAKPPAKKAESPSGNSTLGLLILVGVAIAHVFNHKSDAEGHVGQVPDRAMESRNVPVPHTPPDYRVPYGEEEAQFIYGDSFEWAEEEAVDEIPPEDEPQHQAVQDPTPIAAESPQEPEPEPPSESEPHQTPLPESKPAPIAEQKPDRVENRKAAQRHEQENTLSGKYAHMLDRMSHAESSGNPNAKSKTSSALGSHQFLKATWLEILYKYAAQADKYGAPKSYPNLAAGIDRHEVRDKDGDFIRYRYSVRKQSDYNFIMGKRRDHALSTAMANALLHENVMVLDQKMQGHTVEKTMPVLYMTHHFGATGAAEILMAWQENPQTLFKDVADANVCKMNMSICFNGADKKQPRTVDQVYNLLDQKMNARTVAVAKMDHKPS